MSLDLWVVIGYTLLVITSGIIARAKGDYFTRGLGISFITGVFGLLAIALSPQSNARRGDEGDDKGWPPTSPLAVFLQLFLVFILLTKYWFF